ncbi:penicillin-binding transpeptidase domain-containing protein [Luteococcus sp. H138]|uniref:penicillin-binding transpeptidase domain-containing protein n=1 Tax=unclassified Luteococcus TaxID=2639923 RepID=UPI00313B3EE6
MKPSIPRGLAPLTMLVVLATSACTGSQSSEPDTTPPDGAPAADAAVKQLTSALVKGDVSKLPMTGTAAQAQTELETLMVGMDGLKPSVTPGQITYDDKAQTASVPLEHSLPLGEQTWKWQTTAQLKYLYGQWKLDWQPSIVQSELTSQTRLRHRREIPARAAITGADGQALVETAVAYRVGVDKANLPAAQQQAVATQLATLLKINAATYTKQVKAAGARAFVPAITLREGQVPAAATKIKGVLAQPVELPLGPSSSFAVGLLGTSGQATNEQVAAGKGDVLAGDHVGQSGLQKRYDAQLRGTIGHRVELVQRSAPSASPTPSASPETGASPSPESPDASTGMVKELFASPAKPGTPVAISLDRNLQTRAEEALASQKGIASLAVVKVGSGDLLAAATSTAGGASPNATFAQYPPGSTFKVVSALALLRKGLTPTSTVPCTKTVTVNGRNFENYDDFPAGKIGTITLTDALANSCNTAFLSQHARLGDGDLASAAASLGVGVDHDAGFPSFFGSVPTPKDPVTKAADMIGQGQVEASPMAMAGVVASVASGKTVVPWLVASKKPTQKGTPLTAAEATQLQTMMKAVVTSGSGAALKGVATGAKTGTAEYGTTKPPKTHAWMIAWNGQYAVAALVNDGESGSKDAAPIIKSFLAGS